MLRQCSRTEWEKASLTWAVNEERRVKGEKWEKGVKWEIKWERGGIRWERLLLNKLGFKDFDS